MPNTFVFLFPIVFKLEGCFYSSIILTIYISMITYIKGKITQKNQTEIIIETNAGIGYLIHISTYTYQQLKEVTDTTILTHFIVKEDSQSLYGFAEEQERNLFRHLISVSGVGPATARILLSTLDPAELRGAIIAENIAVLKTAKGIGPKAAKRMVLELKDKLLKDSGSESLAIAKTLTKNSVAREEALAALVALGFNRTKVQKTLNRILKQNPSIDDSAILIKNALGHLAS